jgi:hypothetical protein
MKHKLGTHIYLSGNVKYLDNHMCTMEQLFRFRDKIYLKKINTISCGCIFGFFLIYLLKYDKYTNKYIIPENFQKKYHKIHNDFFKKFNDIKLNEAVKLICQELSKYLNDETLNKCNDLLTITSTKTSNNIILEQEHISVFNTKTDLLNSLYKSMSIPFMSTKKLICDNKYTYFDGIAFIDKLPDLDPYDVCFYSAYKITPKMIHLNTIDLGYCDNDVEIKGGTLYYNASNYLQEPILGYTIPYSNYLPNSLNTKWNFGYSQGIYAYNYFKMFVNIYYYIPLLHTITSKLYKNFGWIFGYGFIKSIDEIL